MGFRRHRGSREIDPNTAGGKAFLALFLVVGMGLMAGAVYNFMKTKDFLATAQRAQGEVVELVRSRSSDSTSYYPVFTYQHPTKGQVRIKSDSGSNPPAYDVGEKVEVLYNPKKSKDAKIDGWFSLWGVCMIFAVVGSLFTLAGGYALINAFKGSKGGTPSSVKDEGALKTKGRVVTAELLTSDLPHETPEWLRNMVSGMDSRGRQLPAKYLIGRWVHPETGKEHHFPFEAPLNLMFDARQGGSVKVVIDPDNPENHSVQIDTLAPPQSTA